MRSERKVMEGSRRVGLCGLGDQVRAGEGHHGRLGNQGEMRCVWLFVATREGVMRKKGTFDLNIEYFSFYNNLAYMQQEQAFLKTNILLLCNTQKGQKRALDHLEPICVHCLARAGNPMQVFWKSQE